MNFLKKVLFYTLLFMNIIGSFEQVIPPISPIAQSLSVIVLDTTFGGVARNITTKLFKNISPLNSIEEFVLIDTRVTDAAGKIIEFLSGVDYILGRYRMLFGIGDYYQSHGLSSFFPYAQITFDNNGTNYPSLIPLVISPFGINTYKGSSGVTNIASATSTTASIPTTTATTTPKPSLLGGLLGSILRLIL